ncbi:hypothetical protein MVEN_00646400 [Mycena venus]|uniref:AB hydrolase-1 domain-containing protein n=1 Tax=Mycena venus TaxID=2733690 RepID=A0A8H7D8S6_9AGAR|nr:hypothetical protein MVEN_00646400 [Mycena venus]
MPHKSSLSLGIGLLPLLVLLALTAGTAASTISSTQRKAQTIRWVDCHDKVPDPVASALNATGGIFTGNIPANLFCGEMDVPMDYTKPFDAVKNNITIGFAMNRPAKRASGLILHHAGGPGENAAAQAWANAFNISSLAPLAAGLDDFDFLAVNCRGLQFSNPLNLSSGVFFNNVSFAFPSTQAEFDQYQAAMKNFIDAAIRDTTPPGIMQHLGAVEIIQDWDLMRAALGYDKVSFAGVSYGTFVGMAYAARYPERVDKFVLDAAFPHGLDLKSLVKFQVGAANRLIQRSDAFCLTDPSCPFHGQGNGSVIKAWETVLARATQSPFPASGCGPGTGCNSPVTPTDLRQAVAFWLRSNSDFPLFNNALNASLHGDPTLLAYQPQFDIRETVVTPLLCSDLRASNLLLDSPVVLPTNLDSLSAIDDDVKTFTGWQNLSPSNDTDPLQIVYSQDWQLMLQCSVWPYSAPKSVTLPTKLKLMWMTSDFDLNLATELTTFAWQQAPESTLVIRHGDDHTSLPIPPGPAALAGDIARNFLRTGVMPGLRSDAQLTILGPGSTRGSIPGAYDVPTGAVAGDVSSVEDIE